MGATGAIAPIYLYVQLTEYEIRQFALYEVKPGILRKAFWVFKLELLL